MDVKITTHQLIKPSKPTPPHLQNLRISFLDQFIPPKTVPFIFYYQHHHNIHQPQLQKSLSEILKLYYPLAGRYIRERNSIECNDAGVKYCEARVNTPISRIIESELIEPKELNKFVPDEEMESATTPLVSIQVSEFTCGGLAIGLRVSHRFIDAYTFCLFTNGWAKACKEGNIDDIVIPKFISSTLFPPREHISPPKQKTERNIVTKRFVFDKESISRLKEESFVSGGDRASTTEVLIALVTKAQINAAKKVKVKQGNDDDIDNGTALLQVVLSLRGKAFKRRIPENCCGNLYVVMAKKLKGSEEKMGLVEIVKREMRKSVSEYAKAMEGGEEVFFNRVVEARKEIEEVKRRDDGVVICSFSSLVNFPFYEADFGWGKPDWVSMTQRDYGGFCSSISRKYFK